MTSLEEPDASTAEDARLAAHESGKGNWKLWGPYLSERAWGTVREDYSPHGSAWDYLSHDASRSKAYRWNEDGLAGICDLRQLLCFALALWNGKDPILKERLFGLTGPEGNHGEDVKECYFYLDSTPTHSYMKMLYKYPQAAFPYGSLIGENARRGREQGEFELVDTGIFYENRYFDVFVEYGKASPRDLLISISAANRGPEPATLHLLPTLWFRNTWAWGRDSRRPILGVSGQGSDVPAIEAQHHSLGKYQLFCEGAGELLFTENETNTRKLYGAQDGPPYAKDAFHEYVVYGNHDAVNPGKTGTKAAALYTLTINPGETATIRLRLIRSQGSGIRGQGSEDNQRPTPNTQSPTPDPFADFDTVMDTRRREADEYYAAMQPPGLDEERKSIHRQALAGMLWSKQFYYYDVAEWIEGDPAQPPPPAERRLGRNREWLHLNTNDVLSMPDKWEYPWFAAWDLAFHCIPLALVDCEFAKSQLLLMMREWYQHPNGQIPAYEWAFGDVNPPIFAWAALRLYESEKRTHGKGDRAFLERVFHKLLLNFTWWVNRKDEEGMNIFQGGFLGLDNIGVFDRSATLPTGGHIAQSDGTSWMGMFSLNMMTISLELALENRVYEDIATKFFEHFLYIAAAMNNIGGNSVSLWDNEDEFFYDVLHVPGDFTLPLKVRSLVGLIPLFTVGTIEPETLAALPEFNKRLGWFLKYRPHLAELVAHWHLPGTGERRLMALVRGHRMKRLLKRALDPQEFLSDYGIRSISRYHAQEPYSLYVEGRPYVVSYEPAESQTGLFGGNSNWRGPIWFPINYLLIESLQHFHRYYGDDFKVECPTGSGQYMTLEEVSRFLSKRLTSIFLRDGQGRRPFNGGNPMLQTDPHWRDHILFHEYFHGDNGMGLGASHQTGWTGLVASLIHRQGEEL
jgi:hypothetical protein